MALVLKATKKFTDPSAVEHNEGFFGVYEAHFVPGAITLVCAIWKDAGAFLHYMPIIDNLQITIQGQDYIDYFITPVESEQVTSPMEIMNEQFYKYLVEKQPSLGSLNFSDWELSFPDGVPATKPN